MPVKFTMLFEFRVDSSADEPVGRTAGWSESLWMSGEDIGAANALVRPVGRAANVLRRRAALLPTNASIVGYRLQAYTAAGPRLVPKSLAQAFPFKVPGTWEDSNDVPQLALYCKIGLRGGNAQKRRFDIRGIPDKFAVLGEYRPTDVWDFKLQDYFRILDSSFGVVIDDRRTVNLAPVLSVDADGLLTAKGASAGVVAGQYAKVLRTVNGDGRQTGGVYRVESVAGGGRTLQLVGWDRGPTKGGKVFQVSRVFAAFDGETGKPVRITTHKVGAPFGQYRGRAAPRRR